ncbi:transporter [Granulicella sp. L46]|uniref:transporter n=1 Tax=Granulicella sp. L46 TaxID=1641865 RepID=UPI00131C9ACA|nr:transporter [Granulicella sp. L46]
MTRFHSLRRCIVFVALAALPSLPAHAENKDMIQLQTQVQQLQDAIAKLQQTNDESFGMLKALIQQTADSVNTMSTTVNGLKLSMQNQQEAVSASNQQVSGQVQSLNDSIDELKARMARMEKALNAIQNQQQTTNAALSNLPQGGIPAGAAPSGPPQAAPNASPNQGTAPDNGTDNQPPSTSPSGPPPTNTQPSAGDMYRGAYADYISARYSLASSEFTDLIKAYPDDNLSGNGWYYLGEMQMRTHKPTLAIKDYDQVLTRYVDNAKVPAALLHKAQALIDTHQNEAAERELHSLIQRFPVSPEASQARAKLNAIRAQ